MDSVSTFSRTPLIQCPCCSQPVAIPTAEILADVCCLTVLEAQILGAVWKGKGEPVPNARIIAAIYSDGRQQPVEWNRAYSAMKIGMHHVRKKIAPFGMAIVNASYNGGFYIANMGQE